MSSSLSHVATNLAGRNCVITGASSGIGHCIAQTFGRLGMNMAILARSEDKLQVLARECHQLSPQPIQVHVIPTDMSDKQSVDSSVDTITQVFDHKVHYLINCAGVMENRSCSVVESDADDWENTLMVNLVNTMRLTQKLSRMIVESKDQGAIVNIGSMSGTMVGSGVPAYYASKHGIRAFSHNLYDEIRSQGTKVSVIEPGMVNTPMISSSGTLDPSKMIQTSDIADAVLYVLTSSPTVCPVEIVLRPQRPVRKDWCELVMVSECTSAVRSWMN